MDPGGALGIPLTFKSRLFTYPRGRINPITMSRKQHKGKALGY